MRLSLKAAENQHEELRSWWESRPKVNKERHPPICGYGKRFYSSYSYSTIPEFFVGCWLFFSVALFINFIISNAGAFLIIGAGAVVIYLIVQILLIFKSMRQKNINLEEENKKLRELVKEE